MVEILLGILASAAGLAIGWLLAHLFCSRKVGTLQAEGAGLSARVSEISAQFSALQITLDQERTKSGEQTARLAVAETERDGLRARLDEEAVRLEKIQSQFRVEFENLANRILEEKSAKFLTQNKEHLTVLLDPLRMRLGEFRERIDAIHTEDVRTTSALREQLQNLRDLNKQMSDEAGALTRALKGESKTQGSWGELILERILEKSGLQLGSEYETQAGYRNESGSRLMPDVVIHLPEGKHLIVDAKVSLTAYERAVNAENDLARTVALREHALSVRRHVDELAQKDYPGIAALQSPDFVLMFVPIESALHLALQQDSALFSDAFDKNVVLVSSSTLLVSLRAVESVWRRHKQTINALEIARQAGNLHDQFVLFVESLQEIGQRLDKAREAYDTAMNRLGSGRGNLIKRTTDLQKLGARADKQLPPALITKAAEGDEEPLTPLN